MSVSGRTSLLMLIPLFLPWLVFAQDFPLTGEGKVPGNAFQICRSRWTP